jgi:hypothetical protein
MVTVRTIAASFALAAGAIGFAPAASAGHVVVGVGISLPGIAIAVPAPLAVVPPYYYGPGYYGPAFVGGPVYGYGYYGRPYFRYGPRGHFHGYAGGGYHHR